jgi:hypothetical protein
VAWTNKSTFEIGKAPLQMRKWRKTDERFKLDSLAPSFRLGNALVMVWGAFTSSNKLPLIAMPLDRQNATNYVPIVYDGVLGFFFDARGGVEGLILMKDGLPCIGATLLSF